MYDFTCFVDLLISLRKINCVLKKERSIRANHLATKGAGSGEQWPGIKGQIPTEEQMAKELTYFNNNKEVCIYTQFLI